MNKNRNIQGRDKNYPTENEKDEKDKTLNTDEELEVNREDDEIDNEEGMEETGEDNDSQKGRKKLVSDETDEDIDADEI